MRDKLDDIFYYFMMIMGALLLTGMAVLITALAIAAVRFGTLGG